MPAKKDEYSQLAYVSVTESAANTLTFAGLSVFSNILTPKGIIIHRIEYQISNAVLDLFNASGDTLTYGLAGDDSVSTISLDDAQVYDYNLLQRIDLGAAATGYFRDDVHVNDFSSLPGGGRLVPADRIYAYAQGSGLTGASTIRVRFHFTIKDLSPQQYLELAQSLRVLT